MLLSKRLPGLAALAALALSGVVFLQASDARAVVAFQSCVGTGFDLSDNVTNVVGGTSIASDCTFTLDHDQDFLNTDPIAVNEDPGFFDRTNWDFKGKIGTIDSGFDLTGAGDDPEDRISGSFDLTGLGLTGDVMLIFKTASSNSGQVEIGLVGYLLSSLEGVWDSPFTEPPFDFNGTSPKSVSHISVYTSVSAVPLPAALPMLLIGLAGLGLVGRRRRRA